jgi:hypothetical protein
MVMEDLTLHKDHFQEESYNDMVMEDHKDHFQEESYTCHFLKFTFLGIVRRLLMSLLRES